MQGHRTTQGASQAVQGGRATGTQPAQRAATLTPCGPAPGPIGPPKYYVLIAGTKQTIENPEFGVGPSRSPCPNPDTHVWIAGAWHPVQQQTEARPATNCVPARPPPAPRAPLAPFPPRAPRVPLAPLLPPASQVHVQTMQHSSSTLLACQPCSLAPSTTMY
jgi:hypothetical protein